MRRVFLFILTFILLYFTGFNAFAGDKQSKKVSMVGQKVVLGEMVEQAGLITFMSGEPDSTDSKLHIMGTRYDKVRPLVDGRDRYLDSGEIKKGQESVSSIAANFTSKKSVDVENDVWLRGKDPKIGVNFDYLGIGEMVGLFVKHADITIDKDTEYKGGTIGSLNDPKIVVVDGARLALKEDFKGYGILVLTGEREKVPGAFPDEDSECAVTGKKLSDEFREILSATRIGWPSLDNVRRGVRLTMDDSSAWYGLVISDVAENKEDYPLSLQPVVIMGRQVSSGQANGSVEFIIKNGVVIPQESFTGEVKILGAALTYSDYDCMVTAQVKVDRSIIEPWGDYNTPVQSNLNDGSVRSYDLPSAYEAGTVIGIKAYSWVKKIPVSNPWGGRGNRWGQPYTEYGDEDKDWEILYSVDSLHNSRFVKVLRDGDPLPEIKPFQNQAGIEDFLKDYVDVASGKIVLGENQAIFLFELGTTNLRSQAADFQDLVVLLTLSRPEGADDSSDDSGCSRCSACSGKSGNSKCSGCSGSDVSYDDDDSGEEYGRAAIIGALFMEGGSATIKLDAADILYCKETVRMVDDLINSLPRIWREYKEEE